MANPHVRLNERDVETEQGGAIEAPADERAGQKERLHLYHRAASRLYQPSMDKIIDTTFRDDMIEPSLCLCGTTGASLAAREWRGTD